MLYKNEITSHLLNFKTMIKNLKLCGIFLGIIALLAFKQQNAEQEFITKAYMSNQYEIAVAKLASEKSNNDAVKTYASMLVDDHQKLIDDLQKMSGALGMTLTDGLDADHQKKLDMVKGSDSTNFDQTFKDDAIASHQQAIDLFEKASSNDQIKDTALKNWIIATLPSLKAHLDQARVLGANETTETATSIPPQTKGEAEKK
jgi:putative membrane protein